MTSYCECRLLNWTKMCEIKINLPQNEEKNSSNVRLILLTIFHSVCACVHYFVVLFGGYITLAASEEVRNNDFLNDMLKMTPLFLTNWNYVSFFFIRNYVFFILFCKILSLSHRVGSIRRLFLIHMVYK